MSLSSILVLVDPKHGESSLRLAAQASALLSVSVDALAVRRDPKNVIPLMGQGVTASVIDQMMAEAELDFEMALSSARKAKENWDGVGELSIVEAVGPLPEIFAKYGRVHGFSIMTAGEIDEDGSAGIDAVLFESGRPALIAPAQVVKGLGKRIAIFWNDSPEAAKAVWAAVPFLREAEAVNLFAVDEGFDAEAALARLKDGLSRAGIAADTQLLGAEDLEADTQLQEAATDMNADLIVMGAFTHSRFRQLILGGVTKSVLADLKKPVFMAH